MSAPAPARRWLPEPRPISPRFSAQLDLLRWVAAFLVCITHVRSLAIADYQPLLQHSWLVRAFYLLHGFGQEAVMIFFLLSGYLVGGEVLRNLHRDNFAWSSYALRRVTRLYPVYLAALLLGGLLDHVGIHLFVDTGLYNQASDSPMIFYDVSARLGLDTLLGNLFFCQELLVPAYGSNVPLWSLTNEAWYYLLFPLACGVTLLAGWPWRRWLCATLLVGAAWFVRGPVLLYFSIWLIGVVPHFLKRPVFPHTRLLLGLAAGVMLIVRLRWTHAMPLFLWHVALALSVMLLLNALEYAGGPVPALATVHKRLAGFSYSLYLLHWPAALFLCALMRHYAGYGLRETLTSTSALYYLVLLLAVYGLAWLVARHTEQRTADLRNWLAGLFARAPALAGR